MNHWGKLIGVSLGWFVTADVTGVLLGLGLGYVVDKSISSLKQPYFSRSNPIDLTFVQKEFFIATFTVMGCVDEIVPRDRDQIYATLDKVMARLNLPDDVQQEAIDLYNEGMTPDFNLNQVILPFFTVCHYQKHLLEMFLEIQLYAAFDGRELHPGKQQVLLKICRALELSRTDFDRILGIIRAEYHFNWDRKAGNSRRADKYNSGSLAEAYEMLNLPPTATIDEIKKAYRRLTSMHHPDKLVAKGLPDEMLKQAETKTREIRVAYERIRTLRNF